MILPFRALPISLAVLALAAVPATARTLDPYTEPLPPNADLPVSQARVLFQGDYCDGAACPPASVVTHTYDFATQDNLASLGGASRSLYLNGVYGAQVVLSIDIAAHRLLLAPHGADVSIRFDFFEVPVPPGMSADFTDGGADAMVFDLAGIGWGPGKSVDACLQLRSRQGDPAGGDWIGEMCLDVHGDGPVVFPFAGFEPQLDFADVDEVTLSLDVYGGMDLSLGPLRSAPLATAASRTSWGRVKSVYR